ncbi:MAG: molybdenum cofactor guanylyltransferase MobA [Rhodospirillaceae bacterium]
MEKPAAVILAGGDGRRLGGVEKALVTLNGRKLIDHTLEHLQPQSGNLALSLRVHKPWADAYDLPVVLDRPTTEVGPLGGIAASLIWATSLTPAPSWVVTVPVDAPFLPSTLIERLTTTDGDIAVAHSNGRAHHAVAAWRPHLAHPLIDALRHGAMAIHKFQSQHNVVDVEWTGETIDPFYNINTPSDLADAAQHLV